MLDPAHQLLPPPSSPTISSVSSSDLDTESTGSFFHDRSTTLGTLMGVNFPSITTFTAARESISTASITAVTGNAIAGRRIQAKKTMKAASFLEQRRRAKWWRICRGEDSKPSSLGEFLEVERRFGEEALFGAAEIMVSDSQQRPPRDGRLLFADGRVLPPPRPAADGDERTSSLCRFPVVLAGICSGCAG